VTLAEHVPGASVVVRSDPLLQSPDEEPAQPVHVPEGSQSFCPLWHSLFKAEEQYKTEIVASCKKQEWGTEMLVQVKFSAASGIPADQPGIHPVILAEHCAPSGVMQTPDEEPAQPVQFPEAAGETEQSTYPAAQELFSSLAEHWLSSLRLQSPNESPRQTVQFPGRGAGGGHSVPEDGGQELFSGAMHRFSSVLTKDAGFSFVYLSQNGW
jgi:hypothetical protein